MAIDNMGQKHPFFMSLLPSFCKTMSRGFSYSFYLAYDYSDNFFANSQFREVFHQKFGNITTNLCPFANDSSVDLKLVKCSYQRKPARAQNDAMLEAYLDGKRYFYRVNDDTVMISKNWTEFLIEALRNMKPPYVGVVGPVQKGKNILTYDFVHRTHVDIFGYYYPHFFTDWWADSWITVVYKPQNSKALSTVKLRHTMQMGQRYGVDRSKRSLVNDEIAQGKTTLLKYTQSNSYN
jgi:hypothetical protein